METAKGQGADAAPGDSNGFSLISNEKLTELYTNLLKCHMIERQAAFLIKRDKPALRRALIRGGEAVSVGVTADLLSGDSTVSLDDDVVPAMLADASLSSVLCLLKSGSGNNGRWPHAASGTPVGNLAQARLHASLGAALTNKTTGNGSVAVVFGREGASTGWQNALHAAGLHGLPIIFVLREQALRRVKRTRAKSAGDASPVGLPLITVDSNDVVAVYRVAHESIERARRGRGPTLIVGKTFQPENEGRSGSSISNMENYLRSKGLIANGLKRKILSSLAEQLDAEWKRQ